MRGSRVFSNPVTNYDWETTHPHTYTHMYTNTQYLDYGRYTISWLYMTRYHIVIYNLNFGGKKVWWIRIVGSLVEKLWQIKVHLHKECYGNSENWQKGLANCCNLPNLPKYVYRQCFYCKVKSFTWSQHYIYIILKKVLE